jgi:hypothetical protein
VGGPSQLGRTAFFMSEFGPIAVRPVLGTGLGKLPFR